MHSNLCRRRLIKLLFLYQSRWDTSVNLRSCVTSQSPRPLPSVSRPEDGEEVSVIRRRHNETLAPSSTTTSGRRSARPSTRISAQLITGKYLSSHILCGISNFDHIPNTSNMYLKLTLKVMINFFKCVIYSFPFPFFRKQCHPTSDRQCEVKEEEKCQFVPQQKCTSIPVPKCGVVWEKACSLVPSCQITHEKVVLMFI